MTDTEFVGSYIETDAELETLIGTDPRAAAIALKAAAAATQAWYCQEATRRIAEIQGAKEMSVDADQLEMAGVGKAYSLPPAIAMGDN